MDLNIAFVLLLCFQEYTHELTKGLKEIGYATLNRQGGYIVSFAN